MVIVERPADLTADLFSAGWGMHGLTAKLNVEHQSKTPDNSSVPPDSRGSLESKKKKHLGAYLYVSMPKSVAEIDVSCTVTTEQDDMVLSQQEISRTFTGPTDNWGWSPIIELGSDNAQRP
eukprot:scaffold317468_cov17-Prasinocladus_malaysianus.AAC.1